VQTSPDLLQQWTSFQSGIPGDGTVKMVTVTNGLLADKGFYRLLIQKPASLQLPQSLAFAILGHSCGGIQEKAYVTGFELTTGNPTGNVYLSTICSAGKLTSSPHSAWATVSWDLAGNVLFSAALSNAPTVNTNFRGGTQRAVLQGRGPTPSSGSKPMYLWQYRDCWIHIQELRAMRAGALF